MNNNNKYKYVHETFKYLHSVPEIGFEEFKTSKFLAQELKKFGYQVTENIAGTGIVGILDSGKDGVNLAFRADMDALMYEIDGEIEYRHTCGHDANSSMVLTMAKEMAEIGINSGKLIIIFQPAEEFGTGARAMIDTGFFDNMIDEIVGIHIRPIQDTGLGKASHATYHSSVFLLDCNIKGVNAHGSRPHLGINALEAGVLAINAVNIVRANPLVPHSVKATQINTGLGSKNVIPAEVNLTFDIRCKDNDEMKTFFENIKKAIKMSVESIGATVEFNDGIPTPAGVYNDEVKEYTKQAIVDVLGEENFIGDLQNTGGEDFHFFALRLGCKASYIGLGAEASPGLHHQDMTFNHDALDDGVNILKTLAQKRLG